EKYRHLAKAFSRFDSNGNPPCSLLYDSHSANKQNLSNLATAIPLTSRARAQADYWTDEGLVDDEEEPLVPKYAPIPPAAAPPIKTQSKRLLFFLTAPTPPNFT